MSKPLFNDLIRGILVVRVPGINYPYYDACYQFDSVVEGELNTSLSGLCCPVNCYCYVHFYESKTFKLKLYD